MTFTFTPDPGCFNAAISNIDLEIPVEIIISPWSFYRSEELQISLLLSAADNPTGLSGEVYDTGIGDFGTKFGVGDMRYRVMKSQHSQI